MSLIKAITNSTIAYKPFFKGVFIDDLQVYCVALSRRYGTFYDGRIIALACKKFIHLEQLACWNAMDAHKIAPIPIVDLISELI